MEPTFEYLQHTNTNENVKGLFAFSFYVPAYLLDFQEKLTESVYVKGIKAYAQVIANESSVFEGWKVLIYTDDISYSILQEKVIFAEYPMIEYVIVRWPYYTDAPKSVRGDVMRVMRFRAFFDFSTIPVFVRDADTIFIVTLHGAPSIVDIQGNELYDWEKNYLEGAMQHPNKWIFGTSLGYNKFWHENKKRELFAPLGAFAGLQSVMPTVSCFQSETVWKEVIDYILESSVRIEKNGVVSYSNEDDVAKIGKDERVLLFILYPNCDPKDIFFFELDIYQTRTFTTRGYTKLNINYPKLIFQRGTNTNIEKLFKKAKNIGFHKNLIENRNSIKQKNSNTHRLHKEKITSEIMSFKNMNLELRDPTVKYDVNRDMSIERYIRGIYTAVKDVDTDNSISTLFTTFETVYNDYIQAKGLYLQSMRYPNSPFPSANEKSKLQEVIAKKDVALKAFLEKALTVKSKDDILKTVSRFNQKQVRIILGMKPEEVPVVKKVGLSSLLGKKGGRTRKYRTVKRKQTRRL